MGAKYYQQYGRELLECGYCDDRQPKHLGEAEKGVAAMVALLENSMEGVQHQVRLEQLIRELIDNVKDLKAEVKRSTQKANVKTEATVDDRSDGMLQAYRQMLTRPLTADFFSLLSPRTQNMLIRGRFKYLSDVTYANLMEMRGCGDVAVNEIDEASRLCFGVPIKPNN